MINLVQRNVPISNASNTFMVRPQNTAVTAPNTARSTREQGVSMLDPSALKSISVRVPDGGWISASVTKHENHSERNPLFIVRGTDINGDRFEAVVNINDVNPRSASFVEMVALDGHFVTQGRPVGAARSAIGALGAGAGVYNVFTVFDFLPPLEEMMIFHRSNRNPSGFAHYRNVINTLMGHIARR